MKKILYIIIICMMEITLPAKTTINWFLAASMIKPAKEVVEIFNESQHKYTVRLITGGSGDLLGKIVLSKYGGIYTPGSEKFLECAKNKNVVSSYKPFLKQDTVFALSDKLKDEKINFDEICSGKYTIITGNPRVMALGGIYQNFKSKLPVEYKKNIKNIALGVNAVQIVNYLKNNNADIGFLFKSLALTHNLKYVEIPNEYKTVDFAYLITLKNSENKKGISEFEKFIYENGQVFRKYGFFLIGDNES